MKKPRFTEQQIAFALRQAEHGTAVEQICRKRGISWQTFYRWRKEFGGLKVEQAKRLKELEKENTRLRKAVSDLTLDNQILKEVSSGNF